MNFLNNGRHLEDFHSNGLKLSHKEIILETKNDKSRKTRNIRISITRVHAQFFKLHETIIHALGYS